MTERQQAVFIQEVRELAGSMCECFPPGHKASQEVARPYDFLAAAAHILIRSSIKEFTDEGRSYYGDLFGYVVYGCVTGRTVEVRYRGSSNDVHSFTIDMESE